MGHIDVQHVTYSLPDGRVLLDDVTFRVPDGATAALVGANGAGKTTLLRMMAGDLKPHEGVHRLRRKPRGDEAVHRPDVRGDRARPAHRRQSRSPCVTRHAPSTPPSWR